MNIDLENLDFEKSSGLLPAIVQHAQTQQVLMLGYVNKESLAKTIDTGRVTFYSRSRETLWTKGESSGNTLTLISLETDCDQDTLLIQALPKGPTCHLGTTSCFNDKGPEGLGFLAYLEALIEGRKTADKDSSYTASLLQGPLRRAAQKVGEEGVETALAAVAETNGKLTSEAADLLYHLMVLLAAKDVKFADVIAELEERHK
jgi:phosphoribosyl-ATP pyrophosphohydrolase/phosphoribosyl-AMP cyclohydrolase